MSQSLEAARLERCHSAWPIKRLRHIARLVGGGTPSKGEAAFWSAGTVPWVSPKDMKSRVISETEDYITEDAVDGSATSFVPEGSPLMVVRSGILRHTLPVALAGRRLTLNQDMKAFRLAAEVDASFFVWWIEGQSSDLLLEWRQFGATVESIDTRAMMNGRIAVPDLDTQMAIAAYLDRETARIDQLIAKKERQVDLLNEEVVSKITSAVESALCSANSPVVALRRFIVSMCDGPFGSSLKSEHYSDEGVRVIRLQNLGVGRFIDRDSAFIPDAYYEGLGDHDVRPGDLLVAGLGDPKNPVGRACVAPDDLGSAMVKADCFRVRLDQRALLHHFLACYFSSPRGIELIGREAKGVTRDRINLSILASIRVPLLPIELQRGVVRKAEAADSVTRRASQTIVRSISLLTEHRAALITAAVTGQLDIREKLPAVTTKPDRMAWRVIVGAEIIHRLPDNPRRGRVKVHKLTYLAEAHLGIDQLQGNYLREAAGPLDRALREETERGLEAAGYYRANQTDGTGTAVTYKALAKAGQHKADLDVLLGPKADELRRFIALFADLDRRQTEAVATLYAVWNDALMDGQTPDDAAIINGFLNDWHTEKGDKFTPVDLTHWLAWMKRHTLIPRGQGPRTTTGRLFV